MGEVYEAEDFELNERVALKTVRLEVAEDERAVSRFKYEIQLARKVTHPNVCRIFDLGYHRASGPGSMGVVDIMFLTMELLEGNTLSDCLRNSGPMSVAEALPIIRQMAAGLAAAHEAGIIHRDFKSANVILVSRPADGIGSGSGDLQRAVITDFGLARRSVVAGDDASALSQTGIVVGTPAYMAPEQVEGKEATPATDIYALGLVMYEMTTGRLPFGRDSAPIVALRRLTETPRSPRAYVHDLDLRWERTILHCLERQPEDRFSNPAEVVAALTGVGYQFAGNRPPRRGLIATKLGIRGALIGLAVILLGLLGLGYYLFTGRKVKPVRPDRVQESAVHVRPSVAVLGFRNLSGRAEFDWLSTALSEMFFTDLTAGGKLRTLPGEDVARMKRDLALGEAQDYARDTVKRIHRNLGADFLVLGAYVILGREAGGRIRLDVRLQNASSGEIVDIVSQTGTEAKLFDLVSRAGTELRKILGAGEMSEREAGNVRASLPADPAVDRLYAGGLTHLRVFEAQAARDELEKAVTAEPGFAPAHAALARAWQQLGYEENARQEAKKAFDLSPKLSREVQLSTAADYNALIGNWQKAVEAYRSLFDFFPDNLDYGLRLAEAQASAGQAHNAMDTVRAMRRLPGLERDDPRIDLAEAEGAHALSDFRRAQQLAAKAAAAGSTQGASLLVARAKLVEGQAWENQGDSAKAKTAFDDAQQAYAKAGDLGGVAEALNQSARLLERNGDAAQAEEMAKESFAAWRRIGNQAGMAMALNIRAGILERRGDVKGALAANQEALALRREINDRNAVAASLNNLGNVYADQGDFVQARKMYEEAADTHRQTGDRRSLSLTLGNLASTLLEQGDLQRAKVAYEESLKISREIGNKRNIAYALFGRGQILERQDDLAGARKDVEESLAIRNEIGEKSTAAESYMLLGEISLEQQRFPEAETESRQAVAEFEREKQDDTEGVALAVLARVLATQRKTAESVAAVDQATSLARKSGNRETGIAVQIVRARVLAASGGSGDLAEASRLLKDAFAESAKARMIEYQLESRLLLAEIAVRSEKAGATPQLALLERDARARGYLLIARKATAAHPHR